MENNIIDIVLIVIFGSLAWWANETLNKVPGLKPILSVAIVAIAILLAIHPLIAIIHGAV